MKVVIFYDGECGFCNQFIHYLAKKNVQQQLKFASLQGNLAREKLSGDFQKANSMVVVFGDQTFLYSRAVCVALGQSESILAPIAARILWLMGPHTDWLYRAVAKFRHKIQFSKSCGMLSPEEIKSFI